MDTIKVIVTGAGSGVGQGIMKALRATDLAVQIIAADINPLNAGLYRADKALLIPRVEEINALDKMMSAIKKVEAHVLMVGSEFDLEFFAANKEQIENETGVFVVTSPLETVKIAGDKWLTAEFLRKNDLSFAEAYLPTDIHDAIRKANDWRYPLMLKTRTGTSSRHVHVIPNEEVLLNLYDKTPFPMLQRMISEPSGRLKSEYTCSIFKCRDGCLLGPFTARRTLRGGSSWHVEVGEFKELHPLLLKIGEKLPILGSLNVQLMKADDGTPIPFEFNARFSGTTAVRAHFGFNEPEMVLRNYFLKEKIQQPQVRHGIALRYLEEVFIEGVSVEELASLNSKGEVRPWF